ncbi:MAG: hypothetical protein JXR49_18360, partial [Acidobacteria bacterium]|nr:hypothetical protein [Acidobacteriota bacterium]
MFGVPEESYGRGEPCVRPFPISKQPRLSFQGEHKVRPYKVNTDLDDGFISALDCRLLACDSFRSEKLGRKYIGVGVGIGIGIELLKTDSDT